MKTTSTPISRRRFLGGAAALTAGAFLPQSLLAGGLAGPLKGVNLGVITYSFRSMPGSAEDLLGYLTRLGLTTVELMGEPIEAFAGAPAPPKDATDRKAYAEEISKWRLGAPMDRFKLLRKKYQAEGVKIEIAKFRLDHRMSDAEIDFCFAAAKLLGARGVTIERSDEAAQRLGPFADKHKRLVGYHNHARVNFNSWDQHLADAKYNAMNLDVGHYVAGTNESPIPLIKKYPDRILGLHLKDRKFNEGPNVPWGQGDTPLAEVLRLLRDEKHKFIAAIELEYPIPDDSDAVSEVGKCIAFCQEALG